jgi:very-short-patch-repair endonuclease
MLMQSWLFCQRSSCFSTTIFAALFSTAEVGHGRPENEGSPLPPEGEGQGEGINLRALHHHSSDAQRVLWRHLWARRLMGYRFRRQVVIEPYIVDFACLEARSIIEADGGQHSNQLACDARRTMQLEGTGYRVMRFWNHEVLGELQHVLEQVRAALIEAPSPRPSPGGEGVRRYCQPTNFPEEP